MLNEVKHLAIEWEILRSFDFAQDRCAQNDIIFGVIKNGEVKCICG
jgi:hypothetical protein